MTNENKIASMDAVGEDIGNLMLKEGGFPHLPNPRFVPEPKQSQSDAWNDEGTKPDHPCLCETRRIDGSLKYYKYFSGKTFGYASETKEGALAGADMESASQDVQWREVQP